VLGSLLCVFGQQIPLDLSLTCKNQQAKLVGNAAKHTKLVKKKFVFTQKFLAYTNLKMKTYFFDLSKNVKN
jgi:hypothetical protein